MLKDENIENFLRFTKPVIDSSLDPLCIINASGNIIYFNDLFRDLVNQSSKDLRESPKICDLIQMELCQNGCQIIQIIQASLPREIENTHAVISSAKHALRLRIIPIVVTPDTPSPIGAVVLIRDLNAQLELQGKYQILLKNYAEIFTTVDEIKKLKDSFGKK